MRFIRSKNGDYSDLLRIPEESIRQPLTGNSVPQNAVNSATATSEQVYAQMGQQIGYLDMWANNGYTMDSYHFAYEVETEEGAFVLFYGENAVKYIERTVTKREQNNLKGGLSHTSKIKDKPIEICDAVFFKYGEKFMREEIYYVAGHPKKVKNPSENRYYFDTKSQKYYEYNETSGEWAEVVQENLLVPQTYFPHTNGDISKQVTLAYYDIIDCYTKREVDKLMPVIPGYISAFENDVGYIHQHQDISGKQDKLTQEELTTLDSGVNYSKVRSWDNQVNLADNKQDALTGEQLAALNSGITPDLVGYYDSLNNLINAKANKASTLRGYNISDSYTTNELETSLNNLKSQLDDASN